MNKYNLVDFRGVTIEKQKACFNIILLLIIQFLFLSNVNKLVAQNYPKVEWATYLGGGGEDGAGDVNIDSKGNITLLSNCAGGAPTTVGVHQASFGGGAKDAMFSKFDAKGKLLVSTYFGGPGAEYSFSHAEDNDGNFFIAGSTTSQAKIASPTAHQIKYGGGTQDGYLAKLSPDGKLLWSTYYGGTDSDDILDIATDQNNNVYIVGETRSTKGIASDSTVHQIKYGEGTDCFLVKFDSNGKRVWSTYFGGNGYDFGSSITISKSGILYIVGGTGSASKISTPGAYKSNYGGGNDGFISKFSSDGELLYGSYYGKGAQEDLYKIHLDKDENYYVAGPVSSTSLSTDGTQYKGKQDVLLIKFDQSDKLLWATYLGGGQWDTCFGIDTDKDGNPVLAIMTQSQDFPFTEMAFDAEYSGIWEAAFTKFTSKGELMWSSYFGGSGNDRAIEIAIDKDHNMYASVSVESPGLATEDAAFQTQKGYDSFLLKMKEVNAVSTEEFKNHEKFIISPNPTSDQILIPSEFKNSNITIYRSNGNPIFNYPNFQKNFIDIRNFPQGSYYLYIEIEGKKKVAQFLKI
jgi:hypothetical protein